MTRAFNLRTPGQPTQGFAPERDALYALTDNGWIEIASAASASVSQIVLAGGKADLRRIDALESSVSRLAVALRSTSPADTDSVFNSLVAFRARGLDAARSLSLSGDASGSVTTDLTSGATLAVTLANSGVAAGTYSSVVVDAKGRVTSGSNPGFLAVESNTLAAVLARGATAGSLSISLGTAAPAVSLDASARVDGIALPSGTVSQRPAGRPTGTVRWNAQAGAAEVWDGARWESVGSPTISATAPPDPNPGDLWWDSTDGNLYIRYDDGNSVQWVSANSAASAGFLPVSGGTLDGALVVNATAAVRSLNTGPLAGYRNNVANGDFRVHQRATASATANNQHIADRWLVNSFGGSRTAQRVALTDADRTAIGREGDWALQYAASGANGSPDFESAVHRIEGARSLAGRTVTLSFWARRTAGSGTVATEFTKVFGTGGSPSAEATGIGSTLHSLTASWQQHTATVLIPGTAGRTFGTNSNDYLQINFWFSAGSFFTSRAAGLGVQSVTVQIADVQVEPGPFATPFEWRPFEAELAMCQRYFQRRKVFFSGAPASGIPGGAPIPTVVTMRATPTAAITANARTNIASASTAQESPHGCVVLYTASSLGSVYSAYDFVDLSAEL